VLQQGGAPGKARAFISLKVIANRLSVKRPSLVKEASEYMRKAKGITAMLPQHNGTRGDMECDIVDYVLEKFPKEKRDAMSLASIVEAFVQSCSGVEAPSASTENSSMSEKPSADEYMFDPSKM